MAKATAAEALIADLERKINDYETLIVPNLTKERDEQAKKAADIAGDRDSVLKEREGLYRERDELSVKLSRVRNELAVSQAGWSRLLREVGARGQSPLDWSKSGKDDPVEQVLNAFKSRSVEDASLRAAHENLVRQYQALAAEKGAARTADGPAVIETKGGTRIEIHVHAP